MISPRVDSRHRWTEIDKPKHLHAIGLITVSIEKKSFLAIAQCHQLYLTQQPVTNWAIYTRLALGWARDLHYLRGRQRCSWVFIRALDLRRREELQAISLSGVVRCWGGEFTRTPIPSQFWRIQTLNLAIAFIVTPRTGLMVQLLGRWCECSNRLQ